MQKAQALTLLQALKHHSAALESTTGSSALDLVANLITALPGKKLEDCLKSSLALNGSVGNTGLTCAKAAEVVHSYAELIESLGKAPAAGQLEGVSKCLASRAEQSLDQLVQEAIKLPPPTKNEKAKRPPPPVNEAVVGKYNRLLEEALGDEPGFSAVVDKLNGDPDVSVSDMISLAKRFAVASTKSKSAALKKIIARHTALMSSRARSAATAGRSAG